MKVDSAERQNAPQMMVGQLAERQSVGAPPLVYTAGKSVERQSAPQMMTFESANPLGGQLAKKEAKVDSAERQNAPQMMVGQLAKRQSVGAPPLVYTAGRSVS